MSETTTFTCDVCGATGINEGYFHPVEISRFYFYSEFHVCDLCWKDRKNVFQQFWAKIVGENK